MDRLTSMAVFVRAAELGSFAAAAGDLRMSPQMVAKHVAWLEARLGTRLLNRTTRRQSLTDIGQSYLERCKIALAEVANADALALDMKTRPSGTLRVNAAVTFGVFELAPFVSRYIEKFPETEVELTLTDRYVDPVEDGCEVALRIGDHPGGLWTSHRLRPYRLIACAAPDYLDRMGRPQKPADLAGHSCLIYGIWSVAHPCRWVFEKDGSSEEVRPSGRFRSTNWAALLQAAIAGHGVTLGPAEVLEKEISAGRLERVLPGYQETARPMYALVPAGIRPTVKIRSFIDALKAEFGT